MKEKKENGMAVVPVQAAVLVKKKDLIARIKLRGAALLKTSLALVIKDDTARLKAAEIREQARQSNKEVDNNFSAAKDTAYKIYCLVKDGIADMKVDADKAIGDVNKKMSDYDLEKKRLAKIESDKAEVEKNRLDKIEKDKLEAQAKKAEAKGNEEKAEILREQAAQVNNFVPSSGGIGPAKRTETTSGTTSGSEDFTIEVTNPAIFIQQVVLNGGNFGFVEFKNGPIKRYAEGKKIGDTLPLIPGCKLTPKMSYMGRAK